MPDLPCNLPPFSSSNLCLILSLTPPPSQRQTEPFKYGCVVSIYTSITSAKIKVNGVPLHYKQTGQGDHAVLLLPGMLGSSQSDFGPQLKSMNKQLFTIVAWDPRGYGHSIPPAHDFYCNFLTPIKALKFKNFSMLGWSDGGITALIAAAKYPTLIHKLVVWGANAVVTQEDLKLYNAIRDVSKWSEKIRKQMEEMYGHEYFAKTCEAWVDGISQFADKPDGNICQHLLPHIKCPTFIIHGGKDPLVPQFHAEYLHKHIKESRLFLMPEGKHNLHLRFAEEFNRLVEDFLR
uniref:Biphenyl hydrolase like n=1 Tax=Gopherus evgoodei TaxID=1825980 RepID=A0A8C4VXL2_9SAUR